MQNHHEVLKKIQKECKNIGPTCANYLYNAKIFSLTDLQKFTAEEALFKIWENNGHNPKFVHTCFLYAIEGAITNTDFGKIPLDRREVLKKFSREWRDSFK